MVAFTLFEGAMILVYWVAYFIWNLKSERNFWSKSHSAENDWDNKWSGYSYKDVNIWQTIARRYKYTFKNYEK